MVRVCRLHIGSRLARGEISERKNFSANSSVMSMQMIRSQQIFLSKRYAFLRLDSECKRLPDTGGVLGCYSVFVLSRAQRGHTMHAFIEIAVKEYQHERERDYYPKG
jgi:hypothetical protein